MANLSKIVAAGALALGLAAGAASAATLSLVGPAGSGTLGSGFGTASGPSNFFGTTGGLAIGDGVSVYGGTGGLQVNGRAALKITVLGYEAKATNTVYEVGDGTNMLTKFQIGSSIITKFVTDTFGPFGFTTAGRIAGFVTNGVGTGNSRLTMAFGAIAADGQSVIALFDDGRAGRGEGDRDDMIVKVEVAAVPLPAAGFMLFGALGGLAALRRRKTAA